MTKVVIGFVAGWLGGLAAAYFMTDTALKKAGLLPQTYSCISGDNFLNRRKYECSEAEFNAQQEASK